jgi:hypothetical protein
MMLTTEQSRRCYLSGHNLGKGGETSFSGIEITPEYHHILEFFLSLSCFLHPFLRQALASILQSLLGEKLTAETNHSPCPLEDKPSSTSREQSPPPQKGGRFLSPIFAVCLRAHYYVLVPVIYLTFDVPCSEDESK